MNRRTVFKHLALASAAAWVLPACVSDPKKVSVALNHLRVTGDDEALIAAIADVMIPATDTPGAVAVKAHLFTLVMVDDCLKKEEKEKYLRGMRSFEDALQSLTGKKFSKAPKEAQLAMLAAFEQKLEDSDEETKFFYKKNRGYIIQGYTSSQHFLTDIKPWQLVPGPHYNGCAPVSADLKTLS